MLSLNNATFRRKIRLAGTRGNERSAETVLNAFLVHNNLCIAMMNFFDKFMLLSPVTCRTLPAFLHKAGGLAQGMIGKKLPPFSGGSHTKALLAYKFPDIVQNFPLENLIS